MYGDAHIRGVVQVEDTLCLALLPRTRVCLKLCFVVEDSCLGQLENCSFGSSFGKCCETVFRLSLCSGTEASI